MLPTEQIDQMIAEFGSTRDALNVALARLTLCEKNAEALQRLIETCVCAGPLPVVLVAQSVNDAALGVVTRSDDWGAESWESAAKLAEQGRFLPGLADKCRSIAAEMRRQEVGECS